MPAPVSIVIPTLNSAKTIGPTLACLFEGVNAGLIQELIISDGGSNDDIETVADNIGAKFIQGDSGRGLQLRRGAAQANAPWILFIHSDTTRSADWPKHVLAHIQTQSRAGYCKLEFSEGSAMAKIISTGANLRSRIFGLPYGDQCLLISRKMYDQAGGFREIPLMEDVAMARSLRGKLRALPITATTSPRRFLAEGWLKRSIKNMSLLVRFLCGADPEKLAQAYRPKD
jgi:rSAM/selenodomain-associated transferase 2